MTSSSLPPPHARLEAARTVHRAGRLDEAEAAYTALVGDNSAAETIITEARHLLGVVALQRGDPVRAAALIGQALMAAPTAHRAFNLGAALQAAGDKEGAVAAYSRALALDAALAPAHLALGQLLISYPERSSEALTHFDAAASASLFPTDGQVSFSLGVALQAAGRLEAAEEAYERTLDLLPDDSAVLVNLGTVRLARGDPAGAVGCHRRALARRPDFALAEINLGAAFQAQGNLFEAIRAYRRALQLEPGNPVTHFNLGTAAAAAGWRREAEAAYGDAIACDPAHAEAHNNLGVLLEAAGRLAEAAEHLRRACRLRPDTAAFHNNLANVLYLLQRRHPETALVHTRAWLAEHPHHPTARHMAMALAGESSPAQPVEGYVRTLFQGFAPRFDSALLGIGYCGPALMAEAFARVWPQPAGTLDVLDAGCGTGLCGPPLRPWARRLVGMDMAPAMLDLAAARGVYDVLEVGDLVPWLGAHAEAFDLVAAADVLCYYGDLVPALTALAGALRTGGHLAFTTEKSDSGEAAGHTASGDAPWRLGPHGRYGHSATGLDGMLAAAGLVLESRHVVNLRDECGAPSWNWVVLARRPVPDLG